MRNVRPCHPDPERSEGRGIPWNVRSWSGWTGFLAVYLARNDTATCYKSSTSSDGKAEKEGCRRRHRLVPHFHRPAQADRAGHPPDSSGSWRLVVLRPSKVESTERG